MARWRHRHANAVVALAAAALLVLTLGRVSEAAWTTQSAANATWATKSAPVVTPESLTGKAVWLRAADITASSGSPVTTWVDRSGTLKDATSVGTAPQVVTGATPSGGQAIRFAGTGGYLAPLALAERYTATATSSAGSNGAANSVDGNLSTYWRSTGIPALLTVQPRRAYAETSVSIAPNSASTYGPKSFRFQGSVDGSAWTTLTTRSGLVWVAGKYQTFTFANTTPYAYYRLAVDETTNVDGVSVLVGELRLNNDPAQGASAGELWVVTRSESTSATHTSWTFGTSAAANHYVSAGQVDTDFGSATMRSFTPTQPVNAWRIVRMSTDGTTWAAYLDGSLQATYPSVPVTWPTVAGIGTNSAATSFYAGDIAEILVRDRVSTPAEIAQITAYLNAEHGLSVT